MRYSLLIEIRPVRMSSFMEYGLNSSMKLSIRSGSPVSSSVTVLSDMSTISALNMPAIWYTSERLAG